MRLNNLIRISSVALLLLLCKAANADATSSPNHDFFNAFRMGGYSSAGITLPRNDGAKAAINEISLILTWENESRLKFFSELELEKPLLWDRNNHFNSKRSYLDLERLYLDYTFSDQINLRAGRFLTPSGRWNELHAAPLVWTSSRPLATSRLFPIAANGLMVFGTTKALEYAVFIEALQDQNDDDDEIKYNNVKGGRIKFGQENSVGLNLMSFTEKVVSHPSYRMLGVDFITHYKNIELSGEAFQRWDARDQDGGNGAYLQAAMPIPFAQNWTGVTRIENLHRPDEGHYQRWLIGTTWHVKPTQLLKLEFTGGSADLPESPRGFLASFAVLF